MASNIVLDGSRRKLVAPSGGVTSGDVVVVGGYVGIALTTAAEGAEFTLETGPVVAVVPKATGEAWSVGDTIYWDAAAGKATKTSTNNTLMGLAYQAAQSADATGQVDIR